MSHDNAPLPIGWPTSSLAPRFCFPLTKLQQILAIRPRANTGALSRCRGRLGDRITQRFRNALGAPVALMELVRDIGRVEHLIEPDIVLHVPVPHQRPAPK